MKKLLGIFVFLVISILPVSFLYAKTFHKENSHIKIDLSVVGTKADISITNIYQNALRGNLAIFDTEPNTNYTNYVFYESNVDLLKGETKKIIYNELDASKNKKYTLIYRATNHQRTELQFSTFWYGIVKGDETADGGYIFSAFGDPTDTRDFSIIINKSLYPEGGDILSWVNSSTIVPIGKFSGNTIGRTEEVPISVKQENGGRYYVGLAAKGTDNNIEMVARYQDQLIFASDKVGKIFFNKDLKYRKSGSSTFYLEGSVDISKHKPTDLIPLDKITVSGNIYTPDNTAVLDQLTPIKLELGSKGVYSFEVKATSLDAGVWYPVSIIFESDTGAKIEYSEKFNTDKGIIPQTGKARDDFFDKNSYRLLAPIPGLVALLDPALCQLEQQKNPGQICDINAFLNFILKLIIGLAAVVLVVRLIIEGYSYMITDTPFKKASAKGNFKEALIGLVMALSSYLILNTINPRLVNNDLKIGVAEFDIKSIEDLGIDAPWTGPTIGLSGDIKKDLAKMNFPAGVFCPGKTGGSGDIATVAKSFINGNISHVTYNNNPGVRGSPGPSNTIYLDCSLYVNVVLGCAGITPKSAPSTFSMKPKGQEVKNIEVKTVNGIVKGYVNGVELHPGDLVGTNNGSHGHVWIYVGNGEILDSQVSNGKKVGGYTVGTTAMSVIKTKKLDMRPYSKVAPMNFVLRI